VETIPVALHHLQHHQYGDHSTMVLFSVRYLNTLGKEVLEKYQSMFRICLQNIQSAGQKSVVIFQFGVLHNEMLNAHM
jgi:hypothetical protein